MAFVFFDSWIQRTAKQGFIPDITLVDRTQYKLALTSASSYQTSNGLSTVIASELEGVNSPAYERFPIEWGSGDFSEFNSLTRTQSLSPKVVTVSGALTFTAAVLLANCPDIEAGIPISSVSPSTDTITTSGDHNRASGDSVMLFSDEQIPGGTDNQSIYYADPTSDTALRLLATPTGGLVDLTSSGLGNQYLRFADGIPVGYAVADAATIIPSGQSLTITLTIGADQND